MTLEKACLPIVGVISSDHWISFVPHSGSGQSTTASRALLDSNMAVSLCMLGKFGHGASLRVLAAVLALLPAG
jgi:hypothetical protein